MSWMDRELKRRATKPKSSTAPQTPAAKELARIGDLWKVIKGANAALPVDLQLELVEADPFPAAPEEAGFLEWLRAPNRAALGFSGNGIRYLWPVSRERKSNNFWIRWNYERQMYVICQRVSSSIPPSVAEYRFNDTRTEYMLRCLVLGKRITPRSVKKKRLWLL